ncbi:YqjK family protein [Hydrogenophaga sp.]|uniref:YqjK family protein n=1 Tax=Hydrogenophaga sp. TaxID=1904254 RepID=UPI003F6EC454
MNPRARVLARRRERLVQRSSYLRRQAETEVRGLQSTFTWVDRIQDAWHWLRANPLAVAGGVGALALWRPRRALGLGVRAWSMWRLVRRVMALRAAFMPPR